MGIINNKQLVKYARGQLGRMYVYGCYGQKGCETVYISKFRYIKVADIYTIYMALVPMRDVLDVGLASVFVKI